jgi:hypothetical protein
MKIAFLGLAGMLICAPALKAQEVPTGTDRQQQEKTTQADHSTPKETGPIAATAPTFQPIDILPTDSSQVGPSLSQEQLQSLILEHWKQLPDNPQPKAASTENTMCPAGVGNSCALLGGWVYYPDAIGLSNHNRTWWEAMKSPGMLGATIALVGTTILDIEGSQACIDKHTCRELNPLMRGPKIQKYAVAMSADAFLVWLSVREKQHGRGIVALAVVSAVSFVHAYTGLSGFYAAGLR